MMSKRCLATLLAWLFFSATVAAQTQQPENVIRLTTDLVLVDTQVSGQTSGKLIAGLKAEDFIIEEEGVRQAIVFFYQDRLPLSVTLLFDLTDTVQPVLKELAQGAMTALRHFKPEDELAVLVYSNKTQVLQGFTRARAPVVKAIELAATLEAPEQLALFNEALYQTAQFAQANAAPRTRRVIVWLTDNLPNRPPPGAHTEDEALAQLCAHDLAVFGLWRQSVEGKLLNFTNWFMRGAGNLFKYAERTGGEVIKTEQEDVSRRLAEMVDRLRARYTLGYISTNSAQDGRFRRLRVRVTTAVERREGKVVLRGKAGYFAKASQQRER